MFYPPPTSFIPITVALSRFAEVSGFDGLYPYWYLGSTPFNYLTGPVVPGILVLLHKVFPQVTLFDLSYLLVVTSYLLFSVGWGLFAAKLSGSRMAGWWVGVLSLFLPWRFFSTMAFGEVSAVLAAALTPWVLLAYAKIFNLVSFSNEKQFSIFNFKWWLPSLAFALLLLTNSTAAIPAIVGLLVISMSNVKGQMSNVKTAVLVIILGWILATFWYGPDYWLTIWGAPSVGGKSLGGALITLLNGLRSILPILLAIVIVYFGTKPKNIYQKFTILWLTVFISITLIRFMADVDFWMDWTSWTSEVEIGIALLAAKNFQFSKRSIFYFLFSIYFVVGWFLVFSRRDFWMPRRNIDNTVEYKIAKWLEIRIRGSTPEGEDKALGVEPLQGSTVFLSGTTAFWLNSLVDVKQVRGGRDETSVDQTWRQAVWEIREGVTAEGTERVLKANNINFVVVHTDRSGEFYHDFKNPQKFEDVSNLVKIYDEGGDVIYRLYK